MVVSLGSISAFLLGLEAGQELERSGAVRILFRHRLFRHKFILGEYSDQICGWLGDGGVGGINYFPIFIRGPTFYVLLSVFYFLSQLPPSPPPLDSL